MCLKVYQMLLKVSFDYIIHALRGYSILSDYTDRQNLETIYQGAYEEEDEEENEEDEDEDEEDEDEEDADAKEETGDVEEEDEDEEEEYGDNDEEEDEGRLEQLHLFNTNRIATQ